jgi:hypothetical protein
MFNLLKKAMQRLNVKFVQYDQLRANPENEYQAMSCGAFGPRFLAKIRRLNEVRPNKKRVRTKQSKI